jgi:hypothetical protein
LIQLINSSQLLEGLSALFVGLNDLGFFLCFEAWLLLPDGEE